MAVAIKIQHLIACCLWSLYLLLAHWCEACVFCIGRWYCSHSTELNKAHLFISTQSQSDLAYLYMPTFMSAHLLPAWLHRSALDSLELELGRVVCWKSNQHPLQWPLSYLSSPDFCYLTDLFVSFLQSLWLADFELRRLFSNYSLILMKWMLQLWWLTDCGRGRKECGLQ